MASVPGDAYAERPDTQSDARSNSLEPLPQLEVKFAENLRVRGSGADLHSSRGQSMARVRDTLASAGASEITPLVQGIAVERMEQLAGAAQVRSGRRAPDLASWYSITLPARADVESVAAQLRSLPEVASAYPAPEPAPAPAGPVLAPARPARASTTPDLTGLQDYLEPAPQGIDADFSRQDPRARGAGVAIVDLEFDWNMSHEDLHLDSSTDLGGSVFARFPTFENHGTAVFGELVGKDNGYGVTGSVPDATMFGISPMFRLSNEKLKYRPGPALVYLAGLGLLEAGDVVLLEQQAAGPGQEHNFVPVEWIPSVFDAVRLLTDLGVVVVEAGANGNQDLDAPEFVRDGIPWFDRSVHDAGAILVGAGGSDHERLFFSDYGSRFDLQGWGSNIVTTGFGDLLGGTDPANHDTTYTATFAGTSGAAAIVTGAAVAVQSYLKATGHAPWSARQIADLLISTGTPQGPATADQHIGPLPNLAAALRVIEADQPVMTGTLAQQPGQRGAGAGQSPVGPVDQETISMVCSAGSRGVGDGLSRFVGTPIRSARNGWPRLARRRWRVCLVCGTSTAALSGSTVRSRCMASSQTALSASPARSQSGLASWSP
ncbi:MAG TPA: S8 family serine peptidase [Jiangellales bacterium]|nr:S8 family serine peptidase [Jiangellales bacterium]